MNKYKDFDRMFIGFEKISDLLINAAEKTVKAVSNYPPYNIKKTDDNKYVIEMGVAGFGKQDIEIELLDSKLVIKGKIESEVDFEEKDPCIYRGLSLRPFTRSFTLADNIEIENATMINGILKVALEAIIPESKKPIKVEIEDINEEGK